jgi:hypothetical protein
MAKLTDKNRLSITHPELCKEWDYEKNGDLKPEDVSYASSKRVWWKCKNGHVWSSAINTRTYMGYGCNSCYNRAGQMVDITIDKPFSYLIGFAQADGSMSKGARNRGKLEIMINYCDRNVIESFGKMIPCKNTVCTRERNNIKIKGRVYNNKKYSLLRVCNKGFRDFIEKCGMPYGKKSKIVKPPLHLKDLSIEDYLRGLYDADGSVGFTAKGFPFLSLTTQSTEIAEYVINYIAKITGKPIKKMSSPKRDDVYNIMITKETAVEMIIRSMINIKTQKDIAEYRFAISYCDRYAPEMLEDVNQAWLVK